MASHPMPCDGLAPGAVCNHIAGLGISESRTTPLSYVLKPPQATKWMLGAGCCWGVKPRNQPRQFDMICCRCQVPHMSQVPHSVSQVSHSMLYESCADRPLPRSMLW